MQKTGWINKWMRTENFQRKWKERFHLHYTVFVMNAFFTIAQMAEKTGIDLWNYTITFGQIIEKRI